MEETLLWPALLYGSWLAVIGIATCACLIIASVQSARRDIARANAASEQRYNNRLIIGASCWLLYFIPAFALFFTLFAGYTDLGSALLSGSITAATAVTLVSLHRLISNLTKGLLANWPRLSNPAKNTLRAREH